MWTLCRHKYGHRWFVLFFVFLISIGSFSVYYPGIFFLLILFYWGVIYIQFIGTVLWYKSMNLVYHCRITTTVKIWIIFIISKSSLMPLWSQPFPQPQDMTNIDLLSVRCNNISGKLFNRNGKSGINFSDFAKYNLY